MSRKILKVTIEDTGIGIPERQLNKLFKLFGSTTFKGNVN
jgi:signal transduction histidine kinase